MFTVLKHQNTSVLRKFFFPFSVVDKILNPSIVDKIFNPIVNKIFNPSIRT